MIQKEKIILTLFQFYEHDIFFIILGNINEY